MYKPSTDASAQKTASYQRGIRKPKCRLIKVCEYEYRDPSGRVVFVKVRLRHDPCICGRGKSFGYYYRTGRGRIIWQKPPDANQYLYRLEEIDPALARGTDSPVYWCEGEKDADAIRTAGALATSHHQGAGKVTLEQAQWLFHARRSYNARAIILVADCDDAGAYDVIMRNNLLVEAGFKGSLRIVRARAGKDAADHLAAGYSLSKFVPVDISRLIEAASLYGFGLKHGRASYTGDDNAA